MLNARWHRKVSLLLLLAFFGIFTHEALPGHAHEHASEPCAVCDFWLHQVAVELAPAIVPAAPIAFAVLPPLSTPRPEHLFEVISHLRGPPAPLQSH